MALDHYISQVYLRRFLAPDLGNLLYGIRKSDLKKFTPRTKDICRLDEGNTNDYLTEPRAIESFLVPVEGGFNAAVDMLAATKPDEDCIYKIAGMASYILSCSPGAQRINAGPIEGKLALAALEADREQVFEPPPASLVGKDLTELIEQGKIAFKVDPKMVQAIGVADILGRVTAFGNQHWEVLHNEHADCPFFTSDFPFGVEPDEARGMVNRVFPLSPNLAVRFRPDPRLRGAKLGFSFRHFSYQHIRLSRPEAVGLNGLLVKCAEDLLLSSRWQDWMDPFIEKNRHFQIVCNPRRIWTPVGWKDGFQQEVGRA
ncbi:DUF4238 domain-containing protein [Hyphomonas sp.]|uniref:DUF4238 domain-containing protein n=1 Tax=Hyphomonas sp. TaxID=87 RepID=UPI0030020533